MRNTNSPEADKQYLTFVTLTLNLKLDATLNINFASGEIECAVLNVKCICCIRPRAHGCKNKNESKCHD
ncbi:hypothetical protein ACTXT7_000621 [Hymenolepis weldensis]